MYINNPKIKAELKDMWKQLTEVTNEGSQRLDTIEVKLDEVDTAKTEIVNTVVELKGNVQEKVMGNMNSMDVEMKNLKTEVENVKCNEEKVYFGTKKVSSLVRFYDMKTTKSGVATFYLTDDGTINGKPYFKNVVSINPTCVAMTDKPIENPHCSVKYLSPDNKQLEINVVKGNKTVVVLGGYMESNTLANDNTVVLVEVVGI